MTVIQKIKNNLKKISAWPWYVAGDSAEDCPAHRDSGLALVDTGRTEDWPIARLCEWQTAHFIARSPERIALLVEYYEAAEGMTSTEGTFESRADRLRQARAKLHEEER